MKLQTKFTTYILISILIFGTVASVSTFYLIKKDYTVEQTKSLSNDATIQGDEAFQILRQSRDLAKSISFRPTVREYFSNPKDMTAKSQLEKNYLEGFNLGSMYSAIYLLDGEGTARFSTDPRFIDQDYSFRDYFENAKKGTNYATVALGITSGELGYYFSSPIYSIQNENEVVGVVVCKLDPQYIEQSLFDHTSSEYNILLTDKYGVIVISSEKDKLFHSLGTLPKEYAEELRANNSYGQNPITSLDYDILQSNILAANETPKIFDIIDKQDNKEEIVSISKVKDFPFYLIYEGGKQAITRSSLRSASLIGGFVGLTAITTLFIIVSITRGLLRPLGTLNQFAEDIGKGKKDIKIDIKTGDELETLGNTLTEMNKKIDINTAEIEKRIEERTIELQRLNNFMVDRELKMLELKEKIRELEEKK